MSPTGGPLILAYLNEKNRPYSAQDVFCNLQKQHGLGKTVSAALLCGTALCVTGMWPGSLRLTHQAVVKAMELLALEGKIKEKTYGKQKIYFADQVSVFIWEPDAARRR